MIQTIPNKQLEDIAKELFEQNNIPKEGYIPTAFIKSIPITMTFVQAIKSYRKYGKIKVPRKAKKKILKYKICLNKKYGVRITNLYNE